MAGLRSPQGGPLRGQHEVPRTLRRIRIVTYTTIACIGAVYLGMQIAMLAGALPPEPSTAPAAPALRSAIVPAAALR